MHLKPIVRGLSTYIPIADRLANGGKVGTVSARYCYSTWLRHLALAHRSGLNSEPNAIAELGPGASLGIGLCGLLTGASTYYGLDLISYAETGRNLAILDQLIELLQARAPIPGPDEFPNLSPMLTDYSFPDAVLTEERLERAMEPARLHAIRSALSMEDGNQVDGITIAYAAPWNEGSVCRQSSVDMIFSQAVLEHVDDLSTTHHALNMWLRPGAFVSHRIDYKSHGTARRWNGHWTYSDRRWRAIRGRRPYLINRQPHSTHVRLLGAARFNVTHIEVTRAPEGVSRAELAPRFYSVTDDDLTASGAFIQAVKPFQ